MAEPKIMFSLGLPPPAYRAIALEAQRLGVTMREFILNALHDQGVPMVEPGAVDMRAGPRPPQGEPS
jgi:hypothetical protein